MSGYGGWVKLKRHPAYSAVGWVGGKALKAKPLLHKRKQEESNNLKQPENTRRKPQENAEQHVNNCPMNGFELTVCVLFLVFS